MNTINQHSDRNDQFDNYNFNHEQFNDSLALIMRKYRLLHIQKQHNDYATTMMNGTSDKSLSTHTNKEINKLKKILQKLQETVAHFSQ